MKKVKKFFKLKTNKNSFKIQKSTKRNSNSESSSINDGPSTSTIQRNTLSSITRQYHSFTNLISAESTLRNRRISVNDLDTICFGSSKAGNLNVCPIEKLFYTDSITITNTNTLGIEPQTSRFKDSSHDTVRNQIFNIDVIDFLQSVQSYDSQILYQVLKSIRNENIRNLHESSGYRLDLLIYATTYNYFVSPSFNDMDHLLSEFWKINEKRLEDPTFFRLIEAHSQALLHLEKNISDILKDRTSSSLICSECGINTVSVLYLPCGHIVVCTECYTKNIFTTCRICSCHIDEYHNVYF